MPSVLESITTQPARPPSGRIAHLFPRFMLRHLIRENQKIPLNNYIFPNTLAMYFLTAQSEYANSKFKRLYQSVVLY
ncbi:MAG: hypothetical protein LBK82_05855 [Planctomycetaceae bacterium]|nr:hypothetical protein [Planctomycetaceae bacterium]